MRLEYARYIMNTQYFRVRFTMTPSVLFDSLNRGHVSTSEIIDQYASQGWELESVCKGPLGLVDHEVIALMKRAA